MKFKSLTRRKEQGALMGVFHMNNVGQNIPLSIVKFNILGLYLQITLISDRLWLTEENERIEKIVFEGVPPRPKHFFCLRSGKFEFNQQLLIKMQVRSDWFKIKLATKKKHEDLENTFSNLLLWFLMLKEKS